MCSQHYLDRSIPSFSTQVEMAPVRTEVEDTKHQFEEAISQELSVLKKDSSLLRSIIAENTVLGPDVFVKATWTKSF